MAVGGRYTPDLLSKAWKEEKKTFQKDCSRYHALLQGSLFFTRFCFYVALRSHEQATEGSFLLLNTRCVSFMCWTEEACWYIEVGDKLKAQIWCTHFTDGFQSWDEIWAHSAVTDSGNIKDLWSNLCWIEVFFLLTDKKRQVLRGC